MDSAHSQSRKWLMVINNPLESEFSHEKIYDELMKFAPEYFCLSDEISSTDTFHTHIFFYSPSPVRFSTIKSRFPTAHIEKAFGTITENRDYISKSNQWAETEKADTSVEGSFFEYGTVPTEQQEKSPEMVHLMDNIREGLSTSEILSISPNFAFRIKDIDILRQTLLSEKYTVEKRPVEVFYLYGDSGTGKTRGIFDKNDPRDIYRVTNYRTGRGGVCFDGYFGQNVLVFEEFNSQIPIEEMLNYLDIYPLLLPARYNDKVACFTQAYITANISLARQYTQAQLSRPETYHAFLRRIHHVIHYAKDGTMMQVELKGGAPNETE